MVGAFKHAWAAYKKYAWGHDELEPETGTYKEWFGVGLTLIDSLDTMYIMGMNKGGFYVISHGVYLIIVYPRN